MPEFSRTLSKAPRDWAFFFSSGPRWASRVVAPARRLRPPPQESGPPKKAPPLPDHPSIARPRKPAPSRGTFNPKNLLPPKLGPGKTWEPSFWGIRKKFPPPNRPRGTPAQKGAPPQHPPPRPLNEKVGAQGKKSRKIRLGPPEREGKRPVPPPP